MSSRRRSIIKPSPKARYSSAFSVEIFVKDSCGVTKTSPSAFRPQPSAFRPQPSAFSLQPSDFRPQPSPLNPRLTLFDSFGRYFCRHRTYRILFFQYRIIVCFGTMVLQPDMVERKSDGVKSHFTLLRLQFTFPYRYAMPSHFSQRLLLLLVAHLVPANLLHPEVAVCLRNLTAHRILRLYHIHVMPMPEAAIHEDAGAVFPQYQVRMPRQPFVVQPVSESPFPQPMSHDHFRLRVLRTNSRHVFVSLFFSQMVRHRISISYDAKLLSIFLQYLVKCRTGITEITDFFIHGTHGLHGF